MALTPGTTLGPYEVLAAIGAGGFVDERVGRIFSATSRSSICHDVVNVKHFRFTGVETEFLKDG